MKTKTLPVLALLVCSQSVLAADLPSAGSEIRQITPLPSPKPPAPELRVTPAATLPASAADNVKAKITRLHVANAQTYTEAALIAATGFTPGSELTLAQLRDLAASIADYYHQHGYFLVQVFLPAQDITNGDVTINVVEAHFGKIDVRMTTNLSEPLARDMLNDVKTGDAVTTASLESGLLLLSDVPGIKVVSTLVPGTTVGSTDLVVDIAPGPRVSGSIEADNYGNRYTGKNHLGATLNINNPAGQSDQLNLRVLTAGSDMNYGRAAYQMQFGRARAGVAYSQLNYALGEEFASLKAKGTAQISSLFGSYPLLRSRSTNLWAQANVDLRTFKDAVESTATTTDKRAKVFVAGLNGDQRDDFGGGGITNFGVNWTHGTLYIDSATAMAADAATARTAGSYDKLSINGTRVQTLTNATTLYATLTAQFAQRNLDISEKIQLGGANGVRAYPEGEAHGDQGYLLNLEGRHTLPPFWDRPTGQAQLIGFIDTGTVTINKSPWVAGQNKRTLSGFGVGLNWTDERSLVFKALVAHKLGHEKATSAPNSTTRFWLQLVKYL